MMQSKPFWRVLLSLAALGVGCGNNYDSCEATRSCAPSGDGDGSLGGEAGAPGETEDEKDDEKEDEKEDQEKPDLVEPDCEEEETRELACGLNERGVQLQTCIEGEWQEDEECEDPDECLDDEEDEVECGRGDLGTAQRTCVEGQWLARLCRHPDHLISAGATHTC